MNNLTLFIPGLFMSREDISAVDSPQSPSLQKLLACSQRSMLTPFTFSDALSGLFNIDKPAGRDCPCAAITRLVDDEQATDGIWMRADPVHLAADQAGLILMDNQAFTIDRHDALVLAADLRQLFADHGLALEAPDTRRWYLKLEKLPELVTMPIHEVTGRDINYFMPTGKDSAMWIGLLNEVQMMLHNNAINKRREANHELTVNSVWFWGAGRLPVAQPSSWDCVFTDEDISRGMAKLAGLECSELPDSLDAVNDRPAGEENILVVLSFGLRHRQYHDINGWLDFIAYLEQFWFAGMEAHIRSGKIKKLSVLTEYQQFDLDRLSLLKFWRRKLPVSAYAC